MLQIVGESRGEGGEIVIPMSEALRAADKNHKWIKSISFFFGSLGRSASGSLKRATPNPQCWTSHLYNIFLTNLIFLDFLFHPYELAHPYNTLSTVTNRATERALGRSEDSRKTGDFGPVIYFSITMATPKGPQLTDPNLNWAFGFLIRHEHRVDFKWGGNPKIRGLGHSSGKGAIIILTWAALDFTTYHLVGARWGSGGALVG
jgi:hypothetical protein